TRLPELILASYSCARRDHMVRLIRALPFSVPSAFLTTLSSDSLRMPTASSLLVGTRRVILSFSKLITNSSRVAPAISCSSMLTMRPTPWAGYTIYSLVRKPCLCCGFFFFSGITLVSLSLIYRTGTPPYRSSHRIHAQTLNNGDSPLGRSLIQACLGSEHKKERRSGTPDRVSSFKTEKSVPATRDASLDAHWRQPAPFTIKITQS